MANKIYCQVNFLLIFGILFYSFCFGQKTPNGIIEGKINVDDSWSSKIYLSYLPSYNHIYTMSSEMIIAETKVNPKGNFKFNLEVLPKNDKLYRLHIPKKSDSKYSLMIGENENYLLLIANNNSTIKFSSDSRDYPFDKVIFETNSVNKKFHSITELVNRRDSIASKSDFYKRKFIRKKVKNKLLNIADSSSNSLVSLYAVFRSDFETDYINNELFYQSYLDKWSDADNEYIKDFRTKIKKPRTNNNILADVAIYLSILIFGFLLGKYLPYKKQRIKKLSVQERKVFRMLKKGASNKEISEEFNIGISTVKSHVSSILSKMNAKSRKELMRF